MERDLRESQNLADVAHRRFGSITNDYCDHSGVISTVFFINVLDHLLAAIVLDIQVDVGGISALPRDKTLEQKPHAYWIDRRYTKAVTHG